jgi:hypothetical protein
MNKILVNSLAKSGTNLVQKLIEMLGYEYAKLGISSTLIIGKYYLIRQLIRGAKLSKNPIIIGPDLLVAISPRWLERRLSRLQEGQYITGHANYTDHLYELIQKHKIKTVQVIRDPRDVLVSGAHYVASAEDHFAHGFYKSLPWEKRVMFAITGGKTDKFHLESFAAMLNGVKGWLKKEDVLTVKFENVIGPEGGGDRRLQSEEIMKIANFIGVGIEEERANQIADSLFGGTKTFRKGTIGSWRDELSQMHIDKLKETTGDTIESWGYKW